MKIKNKFKRMVATGKLFRSSVTGQQVWDTYIQSFTQASIFRDPASNVHNCNHCKNFIRRYGNIVAVNENNKVLSLFDPSEVEQEYKSSYTAVNELIVGSPIQEVFVETYDALNSLPYEKCSKNNELFRLGVAENHKHYTEEEANKFGVVAPGEVRTFKHFHLDLPREFVDMSGASTESVMGKFRDAKNVFQRAMEEISLDTLNLVKDLINQGSLLDGQTHLYKVEQFIPLKEKYDNLSKEERDNWCWVESYKLPFAKFKNELIGVLCTELSEGKELNESCQSWNKRVDPANYMKATAPITKRQIEEAKNFVEENGYTESFNRRFATIDDIKVSEILHSNIGQGEIKNVSIFDNVKAASTRHKRAKFEGVEEVSIDKFMRDILPTCTSVEAFLTNSQEGNMVSLTTANSAESKPIFKWSNNYSWTFNGNLAGKSQIKENVKAAGGKIDGVLRASLQWNDEDTIGNVDFDFHCKESKGSEIYYSRKTSSTTGGWLDVDMIRPAKVGIENITWQNQPLDMEYLFFVRNFDGGANKGFKVEIEFAGEIYNYFYQVVTTYKQDVKVATVTVKNGKMSIQHHLPETASSREIYGLETNNFHKVNLVCLSPNHWGENQVGNKHYLFMLEGCKTPNSIRSFHNENLLPELAQHRKVLEVLGNQTMIEPTDKQLSGLGFNATVRDELIVKLQGTHKRIIKIKF